MTPAEYLLYANTALASLAILGHAKGYFSSGEKTLAEALKSFTEKVEHRQGKTEAKLVEYDRRIQSLEGEMKHMPDRDMAHRLELAVEKMSGRLDTMAETLRPIRATSERMSELLVEQAKK